jgi:hypothetical protein
MSERGMCYRNYNSKSFLPEWDIEEEKYNKWPSKIIRGWLFCLPTTSDRAR